jgi:hypothetical protein
MVTAIFGVFFLLNVLLLVVALLVAFSDKPVERIWEVKATGAADAPQPAAKVAKGVVTVDDETLGRIENDKFFPEAGVQLDTGEGPAALHPGMRVHATTAKKREMDLTFQSREKASAGWMFLPEDVGNGTKLGIFLLGAAISWFLGRWLFLQMIEGDLGVDESSMASLVLLFYLLLVFLGLAFLGATSWLWQSILFLVLILLTLFALGRVVGLAIALVIMTLCIAAGAAMYYVLA